jgi:hypothetical protein
MYIVLRAEKGRNQKERKGKRGPFFEDDLPRSSTSRGEGAQLRNNELPPEHDARDAFAEHLWLFPHPIPFNIAPRSPTTAARRASVSHLFPCPKQDAQRSAILQASKICKTPIQSRSEHSKKPRNAASSHPPTSASFVIHAR